MFEDYLYARISEDEIGIEKGVTRQRRDCRELSASTGGRVVAEFSDNDISALKGAPRPGYEQLMKAVAAANPTGAQRRIICVHTSRLWRNRTERAAGIDILGQLKVIVRPKHGPELHLATAAGRMVAGMLGEVDTGESETKAERIADAARERAEEGRSHGGVLYGWTRQYEHNSKGMIVGWKDVENPTEAAIVREIVDRLLSGESVRSVTDDLNERGVPAPGTGHNRARRAKGQASDGRRWCKSSALKLAVRPANVGLRVWHRGRPDEALLPGAWPRIVDSDKHDRLLAMLADPARRRAKPGSRQHLLTWGIGECGVCEAHLRVAWRGNPRYGKKAALYVCEANGCVGRNEAATDRVAEATMVALLQRPDVFELLAGDAGKSADLLRQAETLRARLTQAAADYADGVITSDQLRVINGRLRPQIDSLEAEARQYQVSPHLELVMDTVGPQARQRWESYSLNQKRAIMTAFGVRVIVLPTRRGPGFDPKSVKVVPRQRGDQP